MNLLNEDEIEQAVDGCHYIVHLASPIPSKEPKEERNIIDPAFKGTLYILKAAQANKVLRVVLTSSYNAITSNTNRN